MRRSSHRVIAALLFGGVLLSSGCAREQNREASSDPQSASASRTYGSNVAFGGGTARTYVEYSADAERRPVALGVALDAAAMNGVEKIDTMVMVTMPLPDGAPAPYEFVGLEWNPHGHEPDPVYGVPHFDFHFYIIPRAAVEAILPDAADFVAQANRVPVDDHVPPFYMVFTPPGAEPASTAVPQMGVHWVDTRSPELQGMLGKPEEHKPFSKTFIYGSWDGRISFLEPMITRAHLLANPDETTPIPTPARYPVPGWYPAAYRIVHDMDAGEYRVALTQFTRHD